MIMKIQEFVFNIRIGDLLSNIRLEGRNAKLLIYISGTLILAGAAAALYTLIAGHGSFAVDNTVPWGVLIAAYAFFVSSVGCCFVGSLESVFRVESYKAVTTRALFLAILIVVVGMLIIFVELGMPFRIFIQYLISPNLKSPIWWMGFNYLVYLVFITLEYYAIENGKERLIKTAGVLAFIAALIAHSTVGSVFGLLQARPFWYGPYMPIDFILHAWILGFSIMLLIASIYKKFNVDKKLTDNMWKLLAVLLIVNFFFAFWKIITGVYASDPAKSAAALSIVAGPLSVLFWLFEIILGTILPVILFLNPRYHTRKWMFVASAMSILGMLFTKINGVYAGLIVPIEAIDRERPLYHELSFSFTETIIVLGAIASVVLVYAYFEKYYFETNNVPLSKSASKTK
ncbi:MAG: hypothetical protein A2176_10470 [Spirochaetes bacterium RBG_13_51_14]|nr:MAG: hypothetical protein A2176_10470 [Spirochaetes bacterium RBG_13_51_14]